MNEEQKTADRIVFNGIFTPEIREVLKKKIASLTVPRHIVARFLGINISTLYKWESGSVTKCNLLLHKIVEEFINGEHDDSLVRSYYLISSEKYMKIDNLSLKNFLSNFRKDYRICERHSQGEWFLEKMEEAFRKALQQVIPDLISSGCNFSTISKLLDLHLSMQKDTSFDVIKRKKRNNL